MSDCPKITCSNTGDLSSYFGAYNFQGGIIFSNSEITVPFGGGFYTAPPGTIIIPVPPNPSQITYQGCVSTIIANVPANASPSVIASIVQSVMTQAALQQAFCDSQKHPNPNPPPLGNFKNTEQLIVCANGDLISQCVIPNQYPPGITFDSGLGAIVVAAGLFTGATQADADNQALNYGYAFRQQQLDLGNMKCGEPCPPEVAVIYLKEDEVTNVLQQYVYGVGAANSKFFCVSSDNIGTNTLCYSDDGLNWVQSYGSVGVTNNGDMAFGNGVYCYIDPYAPTGVSGQANFYSSPDLVTWSVNTYSGFGYSVAFGAGVFVSSSQNSASSAQFYHSVDGVSWTAVVVAAVALRIRFLNGRFVACCLGHKSTASPATNRSCLFYSTDGLSWTNAGIAPVVASGTGEKGFFDVAWDGTQFVAFGFEDDDNGNNLIIATSTNGTAWTVSYPAYDVPPVVTDSIGEMSYSSDSGVFYQTNRSGLYQSLDGVNYTQVVAGDLNFLGVATIGGVTIVGKQ